MDNDADCDDEDERDVDEGAGEEGDDNDDQSHISKKSPNLKVTHITKRKIANAFTHMTIPTFICIQKIEKL